MTSDEINPPSPFGPRRTSGFAGDAADEVRDSTVKASQEVSSEAAQLLTLLKQGGRNLDETVSLIARVHGRVAGVSAASQREWHDVLRQWQRDALASDSERLVSGLALLAAEMNLWQLAVEMFERLLNRPSAVSQRCSLLFNLAIASWHAGLHDRAQRHLEDLLDVCRAPPGHADDCIPRALLTAASDRLVRLAAWQANCNAWAGGQTVTLPVYAPWVTRSCGTAVVATPLGSHHALALFRLQRNRALARRAGVTPLTSIRDAEAWIDASAVSGLPLAILHPDFGLIGIATLMFARARNGQPSGDAGRFHHWIGPGYEGQGYGTQALALLRRVASYLGVVHLFSTIDDDNRASQRTVEKLGGNRLRYAGGNIPAGHSFYHYGCNASAELQGAKLRQLLAASGLVPAHAWASHS